MAKKKILRKLFAAVLALTMAGMTVPAVNAAGVDDGGGGIDIGETVTVSPYLKWLNKVCTVSYNDFSVSEKAIGVLKEASQTYVVSETIVGFTSLGRPDDRLVVKEGKYDSKTFAQLTESLAKYGAVFITTEAEFEEEFFVTVRFMIDGDTQYDSQKVEKGTLIEEPDPPDFEGSVFDVWVTMDGMIWEFDNDVVTSDLSLYAVFTEEDPLLMWLMEICNNVKDNIALSDKALAVATEAKQTYVVSETLIGFTSDGMTDDSLVLKAGKYEAMTYAQAYLALQKAGVAFIVTESEYNAFMYGPSYSIVNTSELEADAIKLGKNICVNASAEGGEGEITYSVYYRKAGASQWTTKQEYSPNTVVKIKPTKAVTYEIRVIAHDMNGQSDEKVMEVTVFSELKNTSAVGSENIGLGDRVVVNASSQGGLGAKQYEILYRKAGSNWTMLQSFDANDTVSFKPGSARQYEICTKVKDARGVIVKKYLTVNVTVPENTSTVESEEINLGEKIRVTCSAEGGSGVYKYQVMYKKSSATKWSVKQEYSDNTFVTIKPGVKTSYDVYVKIKDSLGNIAKKTFVIKVK